MNLGIDRAIPTERARRRAAAHGTGKNCAWRVREGPRRPRPPRPPAPDIVGAEDLAEKVQAGQIEFDRCICTRT